MSGNPFAGILIGTAIFTAGLMVYMTRRVHAPGAGTLIRLMGVVTIYAAGYAGELLAVTDQEMLFWVRVEYLAIPFLAALWFNFCLEYSGKRTAWFIRLAPYMVSAAVTLLAWTNDSHRLFYTGWNLKFEGGFPYLDPAHGPAFWIYAGYSYVLLAVGTVILITSVLRQPQLYRGQIILLVLSCLAPWAGNVIYLAGGSVIDLTPIAFALTGLFITLSMVRFRLFDLIPIARDRVMEHMTDPVLVVDDHGRILDANPAALRLFPSERKGSLIGMGIEEAFAHLEADAMQALAGGENRQVNLGSRDLPLWFELQSSRLEDKRGRTTGRLILLHDINDHKQAEAMMAEARDQALQASLLKSQLIANVSHELRTPLNAILGFSEMLQEGSYGAVTPGQEEVLRLIINSTRQMNLFVGDLLDQSLIEKGKLQLHNAPFSLMELAGSVRGLYAEEARRKGLDLVFNVDPGLPGSLQGDVRRLQQVLGNLVGNALKFTDEGAVRVRFLRGGAAGWVIEVTDTGIGIPHEARNLIFEPFRQVEGETGRKNGGAGLGLAIVKHLVTRMGGHIQVESEPGRGSTFRILLPMVAVSEPAKETEPRGAQ